MSSHIPYRQIVERDLEDYYYCKETGEVALILKAFEPHRYDPSNGTDFIIYLVSSNRRKIFTITSKDKSFFSRMKKVHKTTALLLW